MDSDIEDIICFLERLQDDPSGFSDGAISFIASKAANQMRLDHPLPIGQPSTACHNQLSIYSASGVA